MIDYRLNGNLRLDLARQLLLSVVCPTDTVADIGCGIGIVAEAVAKANPRSRVIGVDISRANIEYAKKTIRRRNVEFVHVDIIDQFDRLQQFSPSGYDVLALVDVIEHIPTEQCKKLFSDLERIARSDSRLVLTYPSPEYQRYLAAENPGELQIIDNVIELNELCREAGEFGWSIRSFRKVDVALQNQYVHCVFVRRTEALCPVQVKRSPLIRFIRSIGRRSLRPFRRWYYRDRFLNRRSTKS